MATRTVVTARQRRLGSELKKLREGAGVTGSEAARVVGMDQAKLSHLEAGRVGPGADRVQKLASYYGVDDAALVAALVAMASERVRGWWQSYRDVVAPALLDVAELEHHASRVREFQVVHVPGLLQTEAYARALLTYAAPSPDRLDSLVTFRMRRQDVLDREDGRTCTIIVHEAALRMMVADRKVARAQLLAIAERCDTPGVTVRVVPFHVEGFAGMGDSMLYASGPVPALDTVQIDQVHGSSLLDDVADLAHYRGRWDVLERLALSPRESLDHIHSIEREL